ncbi:hypothetical protein CHS0354_017364 [Potamilus streckersoni]|uniref:C1q domain-containing protein n=1 Tax=Potamilus streckersoni TaxID=2493646 RepID=A0AAE0T535_9BIVA|nr:hypothetical protein CHS0354_017364 [Potamilus streckersoni]
METLETRLSECTQKTALLEQSHWHQENEIRLQASKLHQLESRANMMDENESKMKKLENRLREALKIIDKLANEVEMSKLERKFDNTSSDKLQACEKCEQDSQSQSLGHSSVVTNRDPISGNREMNGSTWTFPRNKRTSGLGKPSVAFDVTMYGFFETALAVHEILPFNVVNLNAGNGFDSSLKSFICPVTGIYFFTATFTSSNHKFEGSIVMDGVEKVIITTGNSPSTFEQSSSSVVTHCSKGQRVYVFAHIGAIIQISGTFSAFSGFLITDLESMSS